MKILSLLIIFFACWLWPSKVQSHNPKDNEKQDKQIACLEKNQKVTQDFILCLSHCIFIKQTAPNYHCKKCEVYQGQFKNCKNIL